MPRVVKSRWVLFWIIFGKMVAAENEAPARQEEGNKKLDLWTSHPEVTQASSVQGVGTPSLSASSYYMPGLYQPQLRREYFPYHFENTGYNFHVAQHPAEHSLAPTAKHFVIVGFIGLLLLFAILQNSIVAAKRKDVLIDLLSTRRKRDLIRTSGLEPTNPAEREILNDDARVRCIQKIVCLQNRQLIRELGNAGKQIADYLTRNVERSLDRSSGWDRLVRDAGSSGLRGDDCEVLYRDCYSRPE
ncbi:uncharacterized protein LOC107273879 isoform X1 [Cephus cinctus]|uniref:Uncharacterized protein LOC107273879 isoform X1 n=1 Tax=Cephus cinctus TaxID=211228 RepID=A0AAJ7CD95_CEPCN|nr:uncharacterized protein LOC107273879 isoform X1 [Cephus cinctus]